MAKPLTQTFSETIVTNGQAIDIADILDRQKIGPLHLRVLFVSFALILVDGYDILAVAYVAPLLQKEWGFPTSALGPLFGSAVVGAALGPILFGYFADRVGRKPVIVVGTLWFGFFTAVSIWATSLTQLMVLRLLAGLGMGAIIAIVSAYVVEFAPRRARATMTILVYLGILLGGGLGALIAALTLNAHGWQVIFLIGGIVPIAMALVGAVVLPESIRFLTLRPDRRTDLVRLLAMLGASVGPHDRFVLGDEANPSRFSFASLFAGRLAVITPLLWLTNTLTLLAFYFVVQWAPILLTGAGAPIATATLATAAFQICGFVAAVSVMRPVDRAGFLPIPVLFALAIPAIAAIGIAGLAHTAVVALVGVAGFCIAGIQMGTVATQNQVYPTNVRAWGVGFCFAAGRLGAVLGSILAGVMVGAGFSIGTLFFICGAAMLVGVIAGAALVPLYRSQLEHMRGVAPAPALADSMRPVVAAADQ